ncbi:MAG: 4Fe-4S dicluster domain-containing protein [Planctomycetes bacterium]|nr:4Fe-4S dicluster domain-containing protein [Planctomycetota bacterium]MCB9825064.1 4Fe-4S dicluster domain-containing protein [Planctomycetota bacterium]MCB9830062.1 4Fe-4S dicluster domain-containing protein [Planctomycetota bacterium]MCB9902058.1 4Fe-4S dicluster domain-containing protein [Planctomycetota bacterium]
MGHHHTHGDAPDPGTPSRRDFLKLAGFSLAAVALPGCSRSEELAATFLMKPEEVTPGLAERYAAACSGCDAGCGLLVTVRDGRPIKVEGSADHPLNQGRTCPIGQASVLEVYDDQALRTPRLAGKETTWERLDAAVTQALAEARANGRGVRVLTGTQSGPGEQAAVRALLAGHADARHVMVDTPSCSALRKAYAAFLGAPRLPRYRLENAHELLAVDADFLGTWLSPVEMTRGYTAARRLEVGRAFCHHTHVEARVSLTGGCADRRIRMHPAQMLATIDTLADLVAQAQGGRAPWEHGDNGTDAAPWLRETAERLVKAPRGRALVLCGRDDVGTQQRVAWLNHALGADDAALAHRTIDLAYPSQQALGDDDELLTLLADLERGAVDVLVIAGTNPVHDHPEGERFRAALGRVKLTVAVTRQLDATASAATAVAPMPHALASWSDAEPVHGLLTLGQPTLAPWGQERPLLESLAAWRGAPQGAREQLREAWRATVFPLVEGAASFESWWARCVHDGHAVVPREPLPVAWREKAELTAPVSPPRGLLAIVHPTVALRSSRHAHNPWLQELPDPLTKVSWDNAACLAPATAARLGAGDGDVVRVTRGKDVVELPVSVQVGQAEDTVALGRGYGVLGTDRFAKVGPTWLEGEPTVATGEPVGVRTEALLGEPVVDIVRAGRRRPLARAQIYDRLDVPAHLAPRGQARRPHVQHTTLAAWREEPGAGAPHAHPDSGSLWDDDHAYEGAHWGLAIDLARCTGCAACVVACQAENNIPVVGRDEVRRQRDMHWLRIDRYFEGDGDDLSVSHQPMMCQQCDNAPCETVCPVLATVHSEEGLNQQVYNRCVGTRYCSNNCPYKVRRFNWFEYWQGSELAHLVLNPDVTVRTRGVMEKCTFCVQRIQARKAEAARSGTTWSDGDIQTACMQVCPAEAVVFGDMNDPQSAVSRAGAMPRAYRVLDELGVRPSVSYLRRVTDRESAPGSSPDAAARESHHD